MKKIIRLRNLLPVALMLLVATQLQAADIDLATAQNLAKSFMTKQVVNGSLKAAAVSNLKLAKAEASVFNPKAVDYYIFNADKAYVVVAGDDQAPEILMYGEEGKIDINDIPPAMQWLLNKYKYQIDGLKAGTLKASGYTPQATTAVAPLVTANWDQSSPYNNHCPTSGSSRAVTGCPATSLAMCYYRWKWPKTFPAVDAIDGNVTGGYSAEALPEREADWDNIIDEYTGPTNYSSTSAQKDAVAWLMRYAGQAIPDFYYTSSASGANDPEIYQGVLNMGYTDAQYLMLTELLGSGWSYYNSEQYYTDAQWNEWMLAELHAGRPIEYLAYDYSGYQLSGHAFNVFGCNTSGQYYVNWGWSGDSNGYCTLHNFTTATGATGQSGSYVFNYGEAMIIGIEPPGGIRVNPTSLEFEGYVGETYTKTFTVTGHSLEDNITISKQGSSDFTVSPTTITVADADDGVEVTVTYNPTTIGSTNAVLTLSSTGTDDVILNVTGTAEARVPTIKVDPATLNLSAKLSTPVTKTVNVTGLFLTDDITVTLNDQNGVFSVSPTTISKDNTGVDTPVAVNVTFAADVEGEYTGSLTLTSNDAVTKTVALSAKANDGGTASDPYLDIAKYETIDDAGATVSGMSSIYKYTEYGEVAWLTVSNYGALKADATQNWLDFEGTEKTGNETWSATDIFPGSSNYFTGTAYYVNWNEANSNYYVTNCSQVKLYFKNLSSSSYYLYMRIYECTVNADGTITAGTTAIDTKTNTTQDPEVLTSIDLDPSKVYKVQIYNDYAHLYEIGFQTELNIPMIKATPSDLTITTALGDTGVGTIDVRGKMLPGDVTVALNDSNNVFAVSANTISQADAEAGAQLSVTFNSDVEGKYNGTVTLTSGEITTTVNLTGRCNDGGTASDPYLDIAKYETIDDAGATVSYMTSIYNYAETEDYGWLTVSTYGAKKADATQNWLETGSLSDYNNSWSATDIFPVDDAFFGTSQAYGIYGSGSQTFYVTNCTQAKALVKGSSSSTSKATLAIYECTLNASGQPVAAAIAFDSQQGGANGLAVITSAELDASKIYKVQLTGGGSYPDLLAVGFQTPLEQPVEGTPLAEILSDGVDGQEYIVSDDLAVVDFADNDNYAFLTDGVGNWITVYAEDDIFEEIKALAVIAGGSLKGTLSDVSLNPVIYIAEIPTGSTSSVNYVIESINLADPFTLVSDQVVDVTGYWNAVDGALRAYSQAPQGQSLTIDHAWGAAENTMQDGLRYTVRCAINLKEAWKTTAGIAPKDYEYDFQNYIGYALRMPSTSTAINTIGVDANKIVNVYNLQGMLLKQNIKAGDALRELSPGIYLIGGKKVIVK